MAYPEKRGGELSGRWWGEVLRQGVRFKHSFETKKEAEAYEAYVRMFGAEPPALLEGKIATKGRSFREIAERCKADGGPNGKWHKGRDHAIIGRVDYAVARLGDYDIADVTRALIRERLLEDLERRPGARGPLSPATINRYITAASAVLQWAVNEEIISDRPRLKYKDEKEARKERQPVPMDVEDSAVAWLNENGFPVHAICVQFLAETGMRRGEMYKLSPEQIENERITLRKEQTKNGKARTIYIKPSLASQMRAVIASGALPDPTHLLKTFQQACKMSGTDHEYVLHGLRHARRTRLRKAGVPEEVIMKTLGHTSVEVSRGYDHVDLEDQRKAAMAVDKMRGDPGGQVVNLSDYTHSQTIDIPKTGS